jgi:hypothetical protein
MNRANPLLNTLLIAFLTTLIAPASLAGKPDGKGGGNGGGGGGGEEDPPVAAPVEYELHIVGSGSVHAINEFEVMVGRNTDQVPQDMLPGSLNGVRAMKFTTAGSVDLNTLVPASDWILVSAQDINDLGYVAGVAENTVTLETAVFVLEPGVSPNLTILPGPEPGTIYRARKSVTINNSGVIAARNISTNSVTVYWPTAPGSYQYEVSGVETNLPIASATLDISDSGWLVGGNTQVDLLTAGVSFIEVGSIAAINDVAVPTICATKSDGNNWKSNGPFKTEVGTTFANADWFYPANSTGSADINDQEDVLISAGLDQLYHEGAEPGSGTVYTLDSLIATEDSSLWDSYSGLWPCAITNRDASTGFPTICVVLKNSGDSNGSVAILIPRLPQP